MTKTTKTENIINQAQTICQAIKVAVQAKMVTFEISKIVREEAVAVHYYNTGTYDEVFTFSDGSQILWNDSGFSVV